MNKTRKGSEAKSSHPRIRVESLNEDLESARSSVKSNVKFERRNVSSLFSADPEIIMMPVMKVTPENNEDRDISRKIVQKIAPTWSEISNDVLSPYGFKNVSVLRKLYADSEPEQTRSQGKDLYEEQQRLPYMMLNLDGQEDGTGNVKRQIDFSSVFKRKIDPISLHLKGTNTVKNNSFHGFSKHLLDLLEEDITAESLNDISGIRQTTTTSLAHHTARRKATENGNVNKKSYLRRKSCHCTDCGGISKFEDLTKHIVVDLPRSHKTAAARLKTPPQAERRSKSHTSLAPTFNMRERRSTISKINASKLLLKKNISNGPELTSPEISKIKVRKSTKRGQSLPALDLLCDPESNSQVEPICSLNSINEETNCESKPVNAVISQEQDHTKLRDSNAQGSSDTAQETKNVDDKELSQTKPLKSLDKSPRSKSGQKTVMQTVIEENLKEAELASSRRGSRDNSLITSQKIAIEQQPSKTGFQRSDIADSKERLKKIQSSFSQYSTPKKHSRENIPSNTERICNVLL